ncbi:glycosyltransferase [Mycolicibacterium monacense]|uniref:Glycosyl transferase, group 1 n=1 Tax=Mycobacterium sp. (strain JLS) TaxID=164757 RepID=A0A5Q5CJQ7_MYCSJ|nr:glycosyltransferase [Mycolicibacterium monacense]MDA4102857.1 glycosyl transferase family 1 [Mycolicibacterium monacense DSM 44395]OBF49544.1 glycosyl transferase family 1 [Mycolicibacterium monacense]ORB14563.1 glycosyl transferase family 1 [Mycolicibacterium monacense DSM 44395]QHP87481.1 glycosyltransferase family 4 protein [Mycolicibacterium monacense DSM 44395]
MSLTVLINAGPWLTVPPHGYGGIENMIATLIPELRSAGVRVVLATVAGSTVDVDEKIVGFDEPQFRHLTEPYNQVMGIAATHMHRLVTELAARHDVDLVHDHLEAVGPTVLAAAGSRLPPVLHTLHWDLSKHPGLYGNLAVDHLWVNGVSAAQIALGPARLRQRSLGHVHLATPLTRIPHNPVRKRRHVALVARISPTKGQHVAARLAHRGGFELVLAGPVGPYADAAELAADPHAERYPDVRYYRDAVAPLVDDRRVRWVGTLEGEARDRLVATARATLFPLTWNEPGGTAVIESLALGTPVVAYRRGCLPELVAPDTGRLAEPGDEAALAELLSQVDEIEPARCRAEAQRRFSPAVMAAGYLRMYEECVTRGRTSGPLNTRRAGGSTRRAVAGATRRASPPRSPDGRTG